MRCDLNTIGARLVKAQEGEVLQCMYTNDEAHRMVFRDGAWEWIYAEANRQTKQ